MKLFIQYLLDFIFPNKSKDSSINLIDKNAIEYPSIQFVLDKKHNIEILCNLPNNADLDEDLIVELSEKYAQLLIGINYSLLKNQIVETLRDEGRRTEDHQKILLIDNIISFYEALKKENVKSSMFYHFPIVSPSMAFHDARLDRDQ